MFKKIIYLLLSVSVFASCENNKITEPGYSGKDILNDFVIIRDKETKEASLVVKTEQSWTLYSGTSVENINLSTPVAEGTTAGTFPIKSTANLNRYYFQVVTPEGSTILSERHLPIENAYNYRDLGGYKTKDGRHVKWGKLFRADDLRGLSYMDIKYLESIPITCVFDFRLEEEKLAPDKFPESVVGYYRYPFSFGNARALITEGMSQKTADEYVEKLMNIYKMLVLDSISINQNKEFFKLLQHSENSPAVFYCSVGKDRIGVVSALVLASLGVDEEVIMQDYLLTNEYLEERYKSLTDKYPDLKPLLQVNESYLNNAFSIIKQEYGSVDNYLKNVLEVDTDKMQELYLTAK